MHCMRSYGIFDIDSHLVQKEGRRELEEGLESAPLAFLLFLAARDSNELLPLTVPETARYNSPPPAPRFRFPAGLPYLNPWQLPGNGMDAFRLAKEATLRALDAPIIRQRRSRGNSGPSLSAAGKEGIGLVKVSAHSRDGINVDIIHSRL